jgi:hypothetical protein
MAVSLKGDDSLFIFKAEHYGHLFGSQAVENCLVRISQFCLVED